jgi:hypothetical protein
VALEIKVVITPDIPGGFRPDTFHHLLQLRIMLPGLDTRYIHTLIGAQVAGDGDSAELTVHSEAIAPTNLTEGLRFLNGTPMARVRVLDPDGVSLLAETQLNAPLREGQRIAIGDDEYQVMTTDWPGRDRATGVCHGDVDWQHAYAWPAEAPAALPVAAEVVPDGPAVVGASLPARALASTPNRGRHR